MVDLYEYLNDSLNAGTRLPDRNWKGTAVPYLNSFLIVGGTEDESDELGTVLVYNGGWEELPTVGLNGYPYTGGLFWPRYGAAVMTLPSC